MKINKFKMMLLTAFCVVLAATATVTAQVPDWATGTFTARNPQNGGTITLTIERNGNVTANLDGAVSNGSYNRPLAKLDSKSLEFKVINA